MIVNKRKNRSRLWLYFVLFVFIVIIISFFAITYAWQLLYKYGVIKAYHVHPKIPFIAVGFGSIFLGVTIALFVGKLFIKPIENISDAINELSKGNFDVRVSEKASINEISHMAKAFNKMVYALSQVETLQNDFVTNVSHEFKTPISSIEGYATLLQNKNLSPQTRDRYVQKILYNTKKLSGLSENILLLSKIENQQKTIEKNTYRLDEQLRKCVLSLESKWSEKNISFDMNLKKVDFYGCEPLLERVWSNILDNAIKHSSNDSEIHVFLFKQPSSVTVIISDDGEGMSQETQNHIFDKFYQGDKSHTAEGNGLGLALVKRIVELSNGSVSVESKIGKGATFTVSLPQ